MASSNSASLGFSRKFGLKSSTNRRKFLMRARPILNPRNGGSGSHAQPQIILQGRNYYPISEEGILEVVQQGLIENSVPLRKSRVRKRRIIGPHLERQHLCDRHCGHQVNRDYILTEEAVTIESSEGSNDEPQYSQEAPMCPTSEGNQSQLDDSDSSWEPSLCGDHTGYGSGDANLNTPSSARSSIISEWQQPSGESDQSSCAPLPSMRPLHKGQDRCDALFVVFAGGSAICLFILGFLSASVCTIKRYL